MGFFEDFTKQYNDVPWSEDVSHASKIPILIGITLLIVLVVGVCAYCFIIPSLTSETVELDGMQENVVSNSSVSKIYVHVVGAVHNPGVYALDRGGRIHDAIEAAGGFTEDANEESINLARLINDGEQISIPRRGEGGGLEGADSSESTSTSNMVINGKVNINAADAETLQTISGIGPSTADKIIADREANGPFASPEDIKRVSGIGDKKYASFSDMICVG